MLKNLVLICLVALAVAVGTFAASFAPVDSLTVGAFTIDATGSPALTVKPPTRSGILAITADIPAVPPAANIIAGQATLSGGSVTVTFAALSAAAPVCVATDVSAASPVRRGPITATSVTFEGITNHTIEYICAQKNN